MAGGLLITRYDVAAPRETRRTLVFPALRTWVTFSAALLALGVAREFVGHGSLLSGAQALPGEIADYLDRQFFSADMGFVLAVLPPGAFIAMGVLFAARNAYRMRTIKS